MRMKLYFALGLFLIIGVLFLACNGSPQSEPRIVTGTFQSDIGAQPAALSINFGNDITSRSQIGEVISGTITDNGKTTEIKGVYNQADNYFSLSGLNQTDVIYYIEGYLNSSFKFDDSKVNIAKKDNPANQYSWSMKPRRNVTNQ